MKSIFSQSVSILYKKHPHVDELFDTAGSFFLGFLSRDPDSNSAICIDALRASPFETSFAWIVLGTTTSIANWILELFTIQTQKAIREAVPVNIVELERLTSSSFLCMVYPTWTSSLYQ